MEFPQEPSRRKIMKRCASPFGLTLQLVNILKDVAGDKDRNVCFLPDQLLKEKGIPGDDILNPDYRRGRP